VRSYMFRTAANIAVSMLRREKIHQKSILQMQHRSASAVPSDPCGELDAQWLQERLRQAIGSLPGYLGDVVVLRDLGEMPYSDVAKILGITQTAARVYYIIIFDFSN